MNNWTKVAIKIIGTFVVLMAGSFIGEMESVKMFFGDHDCSHIGYHNGSSWKIPHNHWGWRHVLYILMGVALFILQGIRVLNFAFTSKFTND